MKNKTEMTIFLVVFILTSFDGLIRAKRHAESIKRWYVKIDFDYFSIGTLVILIRSISLLLISYLFYCIWNGKFQ